MTILVEDVFVTEGVPTFTFVKPPNFNRILVDIRSPGKPVILEGQSGTGKTTCVRQILSELGDEAPAEYLTAREPVDVSRIEAICREKPNGRFVIDDFHRLSNDLQIKLADIAKLAAERASTEANTKLIIIGINQLGASLIQLVPDIAKRIGIHTIHKGSRKEIDELVVAGCNKLGIEIQSYNQIFDETQGDYWLTQQICKSICIANSVLRNVDTTITLQIDMPAIRYDVVEQLKNAHYTAVKDFCRGTRFRPSNQPYFKVLRAISQQKDGTVDLNELANSDTELRGSINNIKEGRLTTLIDSKSSISKSFHYNKETKIFSIDDPALFYFIKHLNWDELRKDCGFRDTPESFEFEIAISFAGENRALARFIYDRLSLLDVSVFYDEQFEANFLGEAWTKVFRQIFSTGSRFILCLLDIHHAEKIWPTFERENFVSLVPEGRVIPVFLDETSVVGIPKDTVGIKFAFDPNDPEWKKKADHEIVYKLIDKLSE